MLHTLLIVLLVLLIVGAVPLWGYHGYGWYPAGGGGLILLILIILLVSGRL